LARGRRSFSGLFLDKLTELSGVDQRPVGNENRKALAWPEDRYNKIRQIHLTKKEIIPRPGPGGMLLRSKAPVAGNPLRVFVAYSHADKALKDDLLKHLKPLERMEILKHWHDQEIKLGEKWEESISAKLGESDIFLVLVSIDFINSEYCYATEMKRALELAESEKMTIIPIVLRDCVWKYTPLQKFQAPIGAKAVDSWVSRDEAFTKIVEEIKSTADNLRKSRN
jgi:hypothetical protein